MKSKVKTVLNVILDIFIVLFLIFAILVLVVSLTQKSGNVSHIFGYTVNSVQTQSMEAYNEDGSKVKGAIYKGDVIISKLSDEDSYEVGQTVMFYMPVIKDENGIYKEAVPNQPYSMPILVTHNIVEVVNVDGVEMYRTKGINNPLEDTNLKTAEEIVAVYTGTRIGGIGSVIDYVQSPMGFLLCIILPILVFVIIQAIRVIRNFIAYKAQKLATEGSPTANELTEEEKRRIAEEYMKNLNTSDSPEAAPEKKPEEAEEASSEETSSESETDTQE